jgi:hypothetical protein
MRPSLQRPRSRRPLLRAQVLAVLTLCTIALALSGCDKCGDFVWNKPGACRDYGPPQR